MLMPKSVSWYNANEWKTVYELVFSPDSSLNDKKQALQVMLVWKTRCPFLPSGIESTLGLLEVELNAPDTSCNGDEIQSDRVTRLMYSSVIMRFVNHALDDAPFKGQTLLKGASALNIPEWIVNLRHETAHGHELPSLSLLKNATLYAMNWLFDTYWRPQNETIENYFIETPPESHNEQDLASLINNYVLLAICSSEQFKISAIDDIPDEEIKQNLFEFINERIVTTKVSAHWGMSIVSIVRKVSKEISHSLSKIQSVKADKCIAEILTHKESLFMAPELDFNTTFKSENQEFLPDWFVNAFEPLLTLLHKKSLLGMLVKYLFDIVNDASEDSERRKRAGQWIREVSSGLYKSKLCVELAERYSIEKKSSEKHSILSRFHHFYPNLKNGLTLDVFTNIPDEISSKEFITKYLNHYNDYTRLYINQFLLLNNHILDENTTEKIVSLVNIMDTSPDNSALHQQSGGAVRTVADLINYSGEVNAASNGYSITPDTTDVFATSKWEHASPDIEWKHCPLGVLPWQLNKPDNPSFPIL